MTSRIAAALALMASAANAQTTPIAPAAPGPAPASVLVKDGAATVPPGTPIRLMVLREVNSRTARAGDRFKLRVNEPVFLNGAPVVPVGAIAWGEIVNVQANGAVGKGGKLGARFLYVDLPAGKLPLRGGADDRGDGNGAGVVLAVVGFGLLGLLNGGDSARLKAGDEYTAYVDSTPTAGSSPNTEPASTPISAP